MKDPLTLTPNPSPPSGEAREAGWDSGGRFTLGNAGGPGNPYARRTAELRRAIHASVTTEDIQAVTHKLLEQAKEGDVPSAKLLFAYALGKPAEAVEPDAIEFHEWELFCRQPVRAAQIETILESFPVDMIGQLMRYVLPCVVANSKSKFLAMMKARDEAGEGRPSGAAAAPESPKGGTVPPVADKRDACSSGAASTAAVSTEVAPTAAPSTKASNGGRTGVSGPPSVGESTSAARQRTASSARLSRSANGGNGSKASGKRPSRAARILTSTLRKRPGG